MSSDVTMGIASGPRSNAMVTTIAKTRATKAYTCAGPIARAWSEVGLPALMGIASGAIPNAMVKMTVEMGATKPQTYATRTGIIDLCG